MKDASTLDFSGLRNIHTDLKCQLLKCLQFDISPFCLDRDSVCLAIAVVLCNYCKPPIIMVMKSISPTSQPVSRRFDFLAKKFFGRHDFGLSLVIEWLRPIQYALLACTRQAALVEMQTLAKMTGRRAFLMELDPLVDGP